MAKVTCAISGIPYTTTHFSNLTVSHTEGMVHPIFAMPRSTLYPLYTQHCKGQLSDTDSYLLFLAFFHSSGQVTWKYPASLDPKSPEASRLIETNFSSLLRVLEQSDLISHPSFEQPSFAVYYDNSSMAHLSNWILAWEKNINHFYSYRASQDEIDAMQKLENKLTWHILSGESPEKYARVIANWAAKAGEFPPEVTPLWKETIISCFNATKMFNTPLTLLNEIKEHIELNVEVGSIHFHTLYKVINEGIAKHADFLGGASLGYTILPSLDDDLGSSNLSEQKGTAKLATIASNAPDKPPVATDYPTSLAYLKARLAYKVQVNAAKEEAKRVAGLEAQQKAADRQEAIESILNESEQDLEIDLDSHIQITNNIEDIL